jgi:hypothetical protein
MCGQRRDLEAEDIVLGLWSLQFAALSDPALAASQCSALGVESTIADFGRDIAAALKVVSSELRVRRAGRAA